MTGELSRPPDVLADIRALRSRVEELGRRTSGDENPTLLNDIADVRVDSLVDGTINLVDQAPLVYRASDGLWVPGTPSGGGSGFPIGPQTQDDIVQEIRLNGDNLEMDSTPVVSGAFDGYPTSVYEQGPFGILIETQDPNAILNPSTPALALLSLAGPSASLVVQRIDKSEENGDVGSEVFTTQGAPFTTAGPRDGVLSLVQAETGTTFATPDGTWGTLGVFAVGRAGDAAGMDSGICCNANGLYLMKRPTSIFGPASFDTPQFPDDIMPNTGLQGDLALYAFDNGGTTELRVIFPNGTVHTLASA